MSFSAPSPSVESELHAIRALQQGMRHEDAFRRANDWLKAFPENRDLVLAAAISLRHLGRIDEALALLSGLEASQPRYSRLYQERGLCHVGRKDAAPAIEALLLAVNLNPALPMSWRMLHGLYRVTGESEHAATSAAHVETLGRLPPDVLRASTLFYDGELAPAEQIIRGFLLQYGNHPEAMRLLARIGMAHDVLDDAEALLDAVLELEPDYRAARHDLAQCLAQRHKHAAAREHLKRLLAEEPENLTFRSLEATIAVGLGEHEIAIGLYHDLIARVPKDPDVHLWLGHALKTVGRLPDAIAAYRKAASLRLDFGDAFWSLANLKTYRFTDEEIAQMREQEARPAVAETDRMHLCFALGKALEDRATPEPAWTYYARGNAQKRAMSRYRPEIIETNTQRQIQTCTAAFFAARNGWGNPAPDPIFVLGLPRSGSTLVEQILSSHSQVDGTQELPNVQTMVQEMQGRDPDLDDPRYPGCLGDLTAGDVWAMGARFIEETRAYRSGSVFFIDKMPNNFRHIGLIHLMLPNARIIDVRREPMACCFSNLKQLFAQGQEFTYSIEDIARYYRTYLDLMTHWDNVLPGRILRVHHSDVVNDLEGNVRRLLSYCDLPFEEACVQFHKTRRSVRTPSSEQVRQPIFRSSLDQWEQFEPWLGPLKEALGDARQRYRA